MARMSAAEYVGCRRIGARLTRALCAAVASAYRRGRGQGRATVAPGSLRKTFLSSKLTFLSSKLTFLSSKLTGGRHSVRCAEGTAANGNAANDIGVQEPFSTIAVAANAANDIRVRHIHYIAAVATCVVMKKTLSAALASAWVYRAAAITKGTPRSVN
jgi:hypothetical protein